MSNSLFRSNRVNNGEEDIGPNHRMERNVQNDDSKVLNDVINHLSTLEQVQITSTLRFEINGETVSFLDDMFYRETASTHRSNLRFFFTWCLEIWLVGRLLYKSHDLYSILNDSAAGSGRVREEDKDEYQNMAMIALMVEFVILQSLVLFGNTFFRSEDYSTKQYHLVSGFE